MGFAMVFPYFFDNQYPELISLEGFAGKSVCQHSCIGNG